MSMSIYKGNNMNHDGQETLELWEELNRDEDEEVADIDMEYDREADIASGK